MSNLYVGCSSNGQTMFGYDDSQGFSTACEACKCSGNSLPDCSELPASLNPKGAQMCGACNNTSCTPAPPSGGGSNGYGVSMFGTCCQSSNRNDPSWKQCEDAASCCNSACVTQYKAGTVDQSDCSDGCQQAQEDNCANGCFGGNGPNPNPPGPNPPGPNPPGPQPTPPTPLLGRSQQSQSFLEKPVGKITATGLSILIPIVVAFLLLKIMKMK